MATATTPGKHDIVLREKEDGVWSILQDGSERLTVGGAGVHLVDRERAEETADDIASYEKVNLWLQDGNGYTLLRTHQV